MTTRFKDALDDLSIFLDAKSPPFQDCAKAVWAHSQAIRKALELADRIEKHGLVLCKRKVTHEGLNAFSYFEEFKEGEG